MKKIILTSLILIFCFFLNIDAKAQEVRSPIDPKEKTEIPPTPPGENYTWVKAHWLWEGGKYVWKKGKYIEIKKGYSWVDGEWERNQKSGWWKYNNGYWKKGTALSKVKNDENTASDVKDSKEKRQQNKSSGLYIKTGSSE